MIPRELLQSTDFDSDSDTSSSSSIAEEAWSPSQLDEIDYASFYAFTFSPCPQVYQSHEPKDQWQALLYTIFARKKLMLRCFKKFMFVPELTLQGNVHVHGLFQINQRGPYNGWFLPLCKSYGFVLIKDKINAGWYEYMCKDQPHMSLILKPCYITHETNVAVIATIKKILSRPPKRVLFPWLGSARRDIRNDIRKYLNLPKII